MFLESYWSILGVLISVIFGVIGIYLTLRSRYPGKIFFICEQVIELYDAVGNTLDGLRVSYDGADVDSNLVLLNGAFINVGSIDISPEMVEKQITLKLPVGYRWLTAKIDRTEVYAQVTVLDENTLSLDSGLFRCGESIKFHALAQLPDDIKAMSFSRNLCRDLFFEHRICNTHKISKSDLGEVMESHDFVPLIVSFAMGILFSIGLATSFTHESQKIVYPFELNSTQVELVRIIPQGENIIKVSSIQSDFSEEFIVTEVNDRIKGNFLLQNSGINYVQLVLFSLFSLIFWVGAWINLKVFLKYRLIHSWCVKQKK